MLINFVIPIASRIPSDRLCFMLSSACSDAASQGLWFICSLTTVRLVFVRCLKLLQEVRVNSAESFLMVPFHTEKQFKNTRQIAAATSFWLFYFSFQYELRYL